MGKTKVYPDPGFNTNTSKIQLGYGVWLNLTELVIGLAVGFSAVAVPQLSWPESDIPTTLGERAWIASVLTLASIIGCLSGGYLMDKFGRRIMLTFCELPMSIGWFYTGFATSAINVIIGRIITGVGLGLATGVVRVYLTEISLPNMRGVIGSIANVALSMGLTIQGILGSYLHWRKLCHIAGVITAILMCFNYFFPESPYYILMKDTDTIESAKRALIRFRSKEYDLDGEIAGLLDYRKRNKIRRLSLKEKIVILFTDSSCKPFSIILPYVVLGQLSGIAIMMFWTVEMLQLSNTTVDPNQGNVLISVTRSFSGILTAILLFRMGRRPLAITSCFGVGVVCVSIGIYLINIEEPTIYPMFGYMIYVFFGALGYYTLPLMIMYEIYPLQIRGFLGGITVTLQNLTIFAANSSFSYIRIILGFPFTIIAFGCFSLLGSIFVFIVLPETKGLTLQEIEEYFHRHRTRLESQREIILAQIPGRHTLESKSSILNRPA